MHEQKIALLNRGVLPLLVRMLLDAIAVPAEYILKIMFIYLFIYLYIYFQLKGNANLFIWKCLQMFYSCFATWLSFPMSWFTLFLFFPANAQIIFGLCCRLNRTETSSDKRVRVQDLLIVRFEQEQVFEILLTVASSIEDEVHCGVKTWVI